jgi:hypothetical protein
MSSDRIGARGEALLGYLRERGGRVTVDEAAVWYGSRGALLEQMMLLRRAGLVRKIGNRKPVSFALVEGAVERRERARPFLWHDPFGLTAERRQ